MKRMNLACGSVQPEGWDNVDRAGFGQQFLWDVVAGAPPLEFVTFDRGTAWVPVKLEDYDYIVCNHMLSDIGHHDLVPALKNIRSMLKEGGVLRILVPDVLQAFAAARLGQDWWFPQDDRTGSTDAKFCTFVTWFGESRSVFTYEYLSELLMKADFANVSGPLHCGQTRFGASPIAQLDDRCTQALIVEAVR